jgi:hypothetical protein
MRALRRFPRQLKRLSGTTVVTAVGMFGGEGGGWALGIVPLHTLGLTIGGIARRPAVEDGRLETREVLAVTVSVDPRHRRWRAGGSVRASLPRAGRGGRRSLT